MANKVGEFEENCEKFEKAVETKKMYLEAVSRVRITLAANFFSSFSFGKTYYCVCLKVSS